MKAVGASSTNTCTIHDQKSPSSIHELTSPRIRQMQTSLVLAQGRGGEGQFTEGAHALVG